MIQIVWRVWTSYSLTLNLSGSCFAGSDIRIKIAYVGLMEQDSKDLQGVNWVNLRLKERLDNHCYWLLYLDQRFTEREEKIIKKNSQNSPSFLKHQYKQLHTQQMTVNQREA